MLELGLELGLEQAQELELVLVLELALVLELERVLGRALVQETEPAMAMKPVMIMKMMIPLIMIWEHLHLLQRLLPRQHQPLRPLRLPAALLSLCRSLCQRRSPLRECPILRGLQPQVMRPSHCLRT